MCKSLSWGQNPNTIVNQDVGRPLAAFFDRVNQQKELQIFYHDEWVKSIEITSSDVGKTLFEYLNELLRGTDMGYSLRNGYMVVLFKDPSQALQRNQLLAQANQKRQQIERIELGRISSMGVKGRTFKVSGRITDKDSKEPLVGALVQIPDLNMAVTSGSDGSFLLLAEGGLRVMQVSYVNHEDRIIDLSLFADGFIEVQLAEIPAILEEVVIQAGRDTKSTNSGQIEINMRDVKRAPALLGEVDLIKQIQLMPGVSTVSEAASGFNVRGGSVDQNLILYDGLPVFNSSHAFGFFSTFNTEAIRDVSFFRGGIPAEYGGRVSSVLNIRSKEGDYEKWSAVGGIGIVSSNLMVQGPIRKGATSLAASFRSTYSNWALRAIQSNLIDLQNSQVSFFDGSAKVSHKFNQKTKVALSVYQSGDRFRLQDDTTYQWQTSMQSVQLDHVANSRFSFSAMIGNGRYGYQVTDDDNLNGFRLSYQIQHPTLKSDLTYQLPDHKISFGAQAIDYRFQPGKIKPLTSQSVISPTEIDTQRSLELGVYVSDQWDVSPRLQVDAGFRISSFQVVGPGTVFQYRQNAPLETTNVVDTLVYRAGEPIASFLNPEPRLSFRLRLTERGYLKGGYNRIFQYLHLITNTTAVSPVDIWLPSSSYIKPQSADQYSLGFYQSNTAKSIEWFLEAYYKKMNNVVDFKDGAELILNRQLETDLLQGTARAYGFETQISKVSGRLTGMLSYAYARSFRKISGVTPLESVNDGREFPSNFDQPHTVNLTWKYGISRRYFFTGAFTYHTGRPITIPLTAFSVENINISSFSDRNLFRVPDYHRLDIALVIEGNHKRKKFWDGTWTFSLYNAYARRNPFTVFFQEVRPGILRPFQLSVIGTVIPSISYSFKL
jgi:outer membrane cobalamin receptor